MYETFFGLKRRPFLAVPDTESYFSIPQMEAARQTIERTVRRGEGISLIVGPSGVGKTLLLRLLRKSLEIDHTVALIANGRLETPKAFFQQLLYELRLPFSDADETQLRLMLMDFARQETTAGVALLFDEAQYLDHSVLEEIRLLMNGDDGAMPFFRTVLAGTIDIEEKLTHPRLETFNQRIVSRSYLDTLSRDETFRYIAWQTGTGRSFTEEKSGIVEGLNEILRHSGCDTLSPDMPSDVANPLRSGHFGETERRRWDMPHVDFTDPIFTEEAKRQVYQLTEGLPRLINQLCDQAMQLAAEQVSRHVDESLLQSAWAGLQQIDETAFRSETATASVRTSTYEDIDEMIAQKKARLQLKEFDSSVEFGTLDDLETPADVQTDDSTNEREESVRSDAEQPNESPDTIPPDIEIGETFASRTVDQYKPAYPEDDEDEVIPVKAIESVEETETVKQEPLVLEESIDETETIDFHDAAVLNVDCNIDCLIDAVDEIHPSEEDAISEESLEKIAVVDAGLDEAIEMVASGVAEEVACERTEDDTDEDDSDAGLARWNRELRYPIRRGNLHWNGPRKYQHRPRNTHEQHGEKSFENILRRAGSLSLTFREFGWDDVWIGNIASRPLYLSIRYDMGAIIGWKNRDRETIVEAIAEEIIETAGMETGSENIPESPADFEDMKKYGETVLEGRLPFIRREPSYAYQTTDYAPEKPLGNEVGLPYPASLIGADGSINWVRPQQTSGAGVATSYREFLIRGPIDIPAEPSVASKQQHPKSGSEFAAETSRVVRIALDVVDISGRLQRHCQNRRTSLDESFDEIAAVRQTVVSLNDLYRPESETDCSGKTAFSKKPSIPFRNANREIDELVGRMTEAAEKIEQAAGVSKDAGNRLARSAEESGDAARKIVQAADLTKHAGQRVLESADQLQEEIRTTLPSCKELFQELADFQKTISMELNQVLAENRINLASTMSAIPVQDIEFSGGSFFVAMEDCRAEIATDAGQADRPGHRKVLPFPKRSGFIPAEPPNGLAAEKIQDRQNESDVKRSPQNEIERDGENPADIRSLFQ